MNQAVHVTDTRQSGQPDLDIRLASADDHRFIAQCWKESHKDSPQMERLPWPVYKQLAGQTIEKLVANERVIAAYWPDGRCVGFLVYSPGHRISTVHWVYTRFKLDEEKCRRRGVMTLLLDAAELGNRFVFTHRGPRRHVSARRAGRGEPLDVVLCEWLRGRGVSATYVPVEEWLK